MGGTHYKTRGITPENISLGIHQFLTLGLLNADIYYLKRRVDPDQQASLEAI